MRRRPAGGPGGRVTLARAWLALAVSIAISNALVPTRAWAREPSTAELQQARELFSKAERDERARDWKSALEKLERAGAIKMTPGIRFHIALCRENLGSMVQALADYEAAVAQARAENVNDVVDAARDSLLDLRARVPSLSLAIVNAPAESVEVSIDDRPILSAALVAPIRLAPGTHRIVARRRDARDGRTFTKDIELKERDTLALDLKLPAEASAEGAGAAGANGTAATPALPALAPPEEPAQTRSRTSAVLTTAGAVFLVGAGIGSFIVAGSAQDDLRTCNSPNECTTDRTAVRTWDALALAGWISGAAVGAFATVLWLQPSRSTPRAKSSRVAPTPTATLGLAPAWGGAFLAGSF